MEVRKEGFGRLLWPNIDTLVQQKAVVLGLRSLKEISKHTGYSPREVWLYCDATAMDAAIICGEVPQQLDFYQKLGFSLTEVVEIAFGRNGG